MLIYANTQKLGQWDPVLQLIYNKKEMDVVSAYGVNKNLSTTAKNNFAVAGGVLIASLSTENDEALQRRACGGYLTVSVYYCT
jgi:hypothetical protein